MISLDDAQSRLLAACPKPKGELVPLEKALGRILREALLAGADRPEHDRAAMDGYVLPDAQPSLDQAYRCVGAVYAGQSAGQSLQAGQALVISTGARMPDGAKALLRKEYASLDGEQLRVQQVPRAGQDVRMRGEEWCQGDVLIEAQTALTPAHIAIAAANRVDCLPVQTLPRVRVLSSGDEIRASQGDQVPDSNGPLIRAICQAQGVQAELGPVLPDDPERLAQEIGQILGEVDLLITSGGMSVGDRDHMLVCAERLGAEILFHQVDVRPGRPIGAARLGQALWLMLPGSPGAVAMGCALFLEPLLSAMGARALETPVRQRVELESQEPAGTGCVRMCWTLLREDGDRWVGDNLSALNPHHLRTPALADGYVLRRAGKARDAEYCGRYPRQSLPGPVCLAITGPSGSGKTTLIRRLLSHLAESHRVAVIKHSHHPVPAEPPHKDTARFLAAGAHSVFFTSGSDFVLRQNAPAWTRDGLARWVAKLQPQPELVIIEGFSSFPGPRVEVLGPNDVRGAKELSPQIQAKGLLACVYRDRPAPKLPIPSFNSEAIAELAQWILTSPARVRG